MKLDTYYFPVEERPIYNQSGLPIAGYKSIVIPGDDKDLGNHATQTLSIVKQSYKLIPNKDLISPFMEQISALGTRWYIDKSHSFVQPERMRLQITFPDVYVRDSQSIIPLSVYLHNSYNQSEGIRIIWGGIRAICTNGIILGHVLGKFYARHTKGFEPTLLRTQFDGVTDRITLIQGRITDLQERQVSEDLMKELQLALGKRRLQEIVDTDRLPDKSQWDLYNDITYLISHHVDKPQRAELQLKTSQVFQL